MLESEISLVKEGVEGVHQMQELKREERTRRY